MVIRHQSSRLKLGYTYSLNPKYHDPPSQKIVGRFVICAFGIRWSTTNLSDYFFKKYLHISTLLDMPQTLKSQDH